MTGVRSTRPVPWLVTLAPGQIVETVAPGHDPVLLLTHDQALERAKEILDLPDPVDFIVRRTTILQIQGLDAQVMREHSVHSTPTIVPINDDDSPVAWFVVLHSATAYPSLKALEAIRFPVQMRESVGSSNVDATNGSVGSFPEGSTAGESGHYPFVEMDELGIAHNAGLLDQYDSNGDGMLDIYPQHLQQAMQLHEVESSITATPTPEM